MENNDLSLVFEKDIPTNGIFRICFIDSFNDLFGEIIYGTKFYSGKCFAYGENLVGVWNDLDGRIYFYSLYNPGKKISESDYKKELANIRLDINNAPPAFFCLDIKVPNNWEEIFANELAEFKNKK